ncbi:MULTISPECIES: S8 family serine peptidase [unclassified Butyricimonas]|uniref:S8 family serine peptidase n=1 Tax=unclassified Butyricimonas TaxID=2637652 RepID=UPI000C08CD90|nr:MULTISPECIES: S8 family serine peptidase [unclassified Butyricimonas]
MKKYFLLLLVCIGIGNVNAQLIKQDEQVQKKQADLDWYNCAFDQDGVYGVEVNKAYEFLKGKKIKKRPVVALIGTGLDVEHEDLKQAIWVNPKEKADGKDNDKNGFTDDINGWNFLGGKDGQVMESLMQEGDREFLRLKDKYADYMTSNGEFFKIIDGKRTKVPAPENLAEYSYYKNKVVPESKLAGTYGGWRIGYVIEEYAQKFKEQMDAKFPGHNHTLEEFQTCYDPKAPQDSLSDVVFTLIAYGFSLYKTEDFDVIYKNFVQTSVQRGRESYEKALQALGNDGRKEIVGDNYMDIKDNKYGNNVLLTSEAATGTMQAGIIGGKRDNGLGGNGIMDEAEIMCLRVSGGAGEPYLKDMALAIRYAVDHGADVIVLPQQNTLYPEGQKIWMNEAIRYAEGKGSLVIVPVWELAYDLSKVEFFPNRWMDGNKELTNLMVIASSDKNGNPSMNSNYGAKELDLFAPGMDIYAAYMGDTYKTGTGAGLASATVAGVAALVKAYYPNLMGAQIREILLETVTSRRGVEIEKGIVVNGKRAQDLFLFDDLCLSGGIVNAYQAVVAADKRSK